MWVSDPDYALTNWMYSRQLRPPWMGMAPCFFVLVILTAVCASEIDAVHHPGGDHARQNPDGRHPFGASRDSPTSNDTDVTYDLFSSAVTVIFYGSHFVPVKKFDSGDGNATGMPIVAPGSVSLGLFLWASFNLLMGWASTRCVCVYQPVCPLRYCLAHCLAVRL